LVLHDDVHNTAAGNEVFGKTMTQAITDLQFVAPQPPGGAEEGGP
jgi:hypothetical protein